MLLAATLVLAALLAATPTAPLPAQDAAAPDAAAPAAPSDEAQADTQDLTLPQIHYTDDILPAPVVQTRNALLRTARSGDMERMRALLRQVAPDLIFSFGGGDDPIAYWKQASMDGSGLDILADMIKVFSSGYVRLHPDTPEELFVWPYHFVYPLEDLTREQEVELYLLVPAEYRQDMDDAGGYIGFRAAIRPSGELVFFVAGD